MHIKCYYCTYNYRPFSCDQCGKALATKHALIIHERIHTGEKPYSCKQCSKSFSHVSERNRHERSHLG